MLLTFVSPLAAIQIANYDTLTNDRFANDNSFVADQFDLSGVGFNGTGSGGAGWVTMISENVYITANHADPAVGSTVTFYASNDPNGTSVNRTISSNRQQIQGTDILVGTLDSALPSGFTFYDFATEDIVNNGDLQNSPYNGANAYILGRSPTGWPTSQNMAVGRNVLDGFQSSVTAPGGTGSAFEATDDGASGVTYEAMLQGGDSGAPLFVENSQGGLTIVGINWYIRNSSTILGATYVGNYDDQDTNGNDGIQTFIDANPVPEPSTVAFLLTVASGVLALRRKV
ncbi:PEP-CTERM sorting domain-containing protein [Coraliomargarita sinensis]|uniref:PEP-CTERM sorting domain-containing protein n=1 Tax=Coraliomargarita sinensis TaxID=2174842 RepID=UPI001304CD5C|nr:PEP-CTERM sorting domain-containing protein [Coraliomargarita sinensis]